MGDAVGLQTSRGQEKLRDGKQVCQLMGDFLRAGC